MEDDLLRKEVEKLAEKVEILDTELEPDVVAGMLRLLLEGFSADSIAEEYELRPEEGV